MDEEAQEMLFVADGSQTLGRSVRTEIQGAGIARDEDEIFLLATQLGRTDMPAQEILLGGVLVMHNARYRLPSASKCLREGHLAVFCEHFTGSDQSATAAHIPKRYTHNLIVRPIVLHRGSPFAA